MEGYFIRALKGKKCHFVLTKTFRKKTGCKLFREKVTFYSAGECDGEKNVCFLPSLCREKNCRGGKAACLPKWLPVTSQAVIPGSKEKGMSGLSFPWKDGPKEVQADFLAPAVKTGFAPKETQLIA